jgi:hypothetical protein
MLVCSLYNSLMSTYDKYVLFYRMMSKDWMCCYADYMRLTYNEAIFQVRLHHSPESQMSA